MKYGPGILTKDELNKIGEGMPLGSFLNMHLTPITFNQERLYIQPHEYNSMKVITLPYEYYQEEKKRLDLNPSTDRVPEKKDKK